MLLARSTQIAANLWQFTTATNSHFAFNCYLIVGDKTALIHTGKPSQFNQMLKLLEQALAGQTLDMCCFRMLKPMNVGRWLLYLLNSQIAKLFVIRLRLFH